MSTQCILPWSEFQSLSRRRVLADFGGGDVTSDAGALLLREVEQGAQIIKRFSSCFMDHRNPEAVEHSLVELIGQRIYGIALGYEDLNDHDELRRDPLLATLVGKLDPTGQSRKRKQDKGCALAGKSTLNRLEQAQRAKKGARYHKIDYQEAAVEDFFVTTFLDAHKRPPKELVLDLDATDDPLHGQQEGRFFHGYYQCYCYLPLYIFSGDFLLSSKLRPSNIDASKGSVEEVERIVKGIRKRWPAVRIILRADSGFARDGLMAWCEEHRVDYVFGLARNNRLVTAIRKQMHKAKRRYFSAGKASRRFRDFRYRTQKSWSCERRVVGKAEYMAKGENPRFVVTSLSRRDYPAEKLYEKLYCARGDMENRIKEQQLWLFADRTSTSTMRSNQLRLWFSSVAYVLINELRRVGLAGTKLARAQVGTIRNKLLKIGAIVTVSVRRVYARLSSAYPYQQLFRQIHEKIRAYYALNS